MYREFKRKLLAYKREKENGTNAPTASPPHPSVVKTQIPATQEAQQPATQGSQAAATQGAQQPATQGPQAASTQGKQKLTEEQKKRMKEEYEKLQKMIEETKAMLNNLQVKPQDPLVLERQRKVKSIISGDLSMDYPSTTKVVRIFTSSTFTDTKFERNRLMEHAYPRMKEFCQMKGYEFQVVDMRWGIQHEAANDHSTVDLCLQELRNCQRLSTGPNFVSLLSHKYGYRTLNRQIDVTEFEALLGYEGMDQNTRNLLKRWYKKDENACPPEYVLLPINHNIPQYLSQNEDEQKTAKDQWWKESEEMVLALREASGKLLSEKDALKYTISVTEIETQAGVLESEEPNKHCLWYHRVIDNIEDQPQSYQLSRFIECTGEENQWKEARNLQKSLQSKMSESLGEDNVHTYHVNWADKGIDPQLPEHSQYLDKMASDFESRMMTMIEKSIEERESHDQYLNKPLHTECVQHLQFCQEKLKGFYGREDTLKKIADYITGDSKEPLVVHGLSGCGKTCIMAAAAQKAFELVKGKGAVILRFLGTTPDSSDVVSLLHSLIEHIYRLLVQPFQRVQGSVKLLKARFKQSVLFLRKKADQKFVIILDSVDQLDASNDGRQVLSWILKTLPENVKIIISTLENKEYEAFPLLKAELSEQSFVIVPDFSLDGAIEIIDHWSKDRKRQLTQLQKSKLIDAFKSFSLPLFLKLSAEKAFQWRSFRPENNVLFETTIKEAIHALFGRIEKRHGRTLVSHALGYITTAKLGMSEAELEDVLSCDDEVLNNVYQYWTPPVRRLPPLLLVRLRASLQQYLVERGVDGIKVLYWYHRQFIETARERYLSDPITVQKLHQGLADFLSGKWANESAKPFTTKKGEESSAIRYVSAQPIKRGDTYNIRKLNNLPYHLIKGNMLDELKRECLLNVDFLLTKIQNTSIESVLEDFQLARAAFPADQQISTLGDTVYLSWKALQFDARQFTAQFIDRLSHDKNLASFVEDCRAHPVPYLKATKDFLIRPGGPLTYSLPGHSGAFLNGLDLCKREDGTLIAATGGNDGCLRIWNASEGHLLKSCGRFGDEVSLIRFAANNSRIVVDYEKHVVVFDLDGNKLYTLTSQGQVFREVSGEGRDKLVCFGEKETLIYSVADGSLLDTLQSPAKAKLGIPAMTGSSINYIAMTGDIQERFGYLHLPTKTFSKFLKPKNDVTGFAFLKEEKELIVCHDNPFEFDFYETSSLTKMRSFQVGSGIQGSFGPSPVHISSDEKFLYFTEDIYVSIVDLQQEKQIRQFKHPLSSSECLTLDEKTWVTTSEDCLVRVWNSEISIDTEPQSEQQKKKNSSSLREVFPMKNTRYLMLLINNDSKEKDDSCEQILQVYDIPTDSVVREVTLKTKDRSNDSILLDDQHLIIALGNRKIKMINLDTLTVVLTFQGLTPPNEAHLAVVNNKTELLSQSRSRCSMKLFSIETGKTVAMIKQPEGHKQTICTVTTNLAGTTCVAYTDDELILVYNLVSRTLLSILKPSEFGLSDFDMDNHPITLSGEYAVLTGTKNIKGGCGVTAGVLWDIHNKTKKSNLFDLKDHTLYQHYPGKDRPNVGFTEKVMIDDTHFVAVCDDGTTRVWDVKTGELIQRLKGHGNESCLEIYYVANGPFFVTYASADEENALRIWNKESWECIASFKLENCLRNLYMLSDGKSFIARTREDDLLHFKLFNHPVSVDLSSQPEMFSGVVTDRTLEFTSDQIINDPDDPDQEEDEKEDTISDIEDDDDEEDKSDEESEEGDD